MEIMKKYSKVGVGIGFPVILYKGKPKLRTGVDLIEQSLLDIFNSDEPRYFLGEYKSRLAEAMFEPVDKIAISLLRLFIKDAIKTWEKRIVLLYLDFEIDNATINCSIFYRIKGEKKTNNFIYPFYRKLQY